MSYGRANHYLVYFAKAQYPLLAAKACSVSGVSASDGASCQHWILNNGDVTFDDVIDVYYH